jgi:hypothetical protein
MATKKPVVFALPVINSMQDIGYQQAKLGNTMRYIALAAMEREPELPESFSEDGKTQYHAGVDLCYNDLHPAKTYFKLDGNWLPAESFDAGADVSSLETRQVGVTCMLLTGQEFGALNNSKSGTYDPSMYQVVGAWRDKVKKYRHNKVKDLVAEIKKIQAEGKPRTRAARDDFAEWQKGWFDSAEKRCKTSVSQYSDTTADLVKFKRAKAAFIKEYGADQDC